MPRPRLLLMTPLPPPSGGMATWTVRMLGSSLVQRYDVRVIDTNAGTEARGVSGRKLARAAAWGARLAKDLATWRPDVVHVNAAALLPGVYKDLAFARLARAGGARTVLEIHGSQLDGLERAPYALARRWLRGIDRVLALSDGVRARLQSLGATADVVGNPVDLRPEVRHPPHDGPARVLFVGWVMPAKGVLEAIEAVARVPGTTLTLLGRFVDLHGVDSAGTVGALIERLGVADRVTLAGEVPLDAVWGHYARADVFVLPSHTEGLPNTLLEAMMAGLPAIVTPVGAMGEVVQDGVAGRVVPVRDVAALTDALAALVADPAARRAMGERARAAAVERFATEVVATRLADLYDSLLGVHTRSE